MFNSDEDCLAYLGASKASQGYACVKCGHTKHTVRRKNLARDCNKCHHLESPTAGTLFHKVKFGLRKAFGMVFEMSATTKSIYATQMSKRDEVRYVTASLLMLMVRKAITSSGKDPMN